MNLKQSNQRHAAHVAGLMADTKASSTSVLGSIWHWVDGVANGISNLVTRPLPGGFRAIDHALENVHEGFTDFEQALERFHWWFHHVYIGIIPRWLHSLHTQTQGEIAALRRYLVRLIFVTTQTVLSIAMHAVRAERSERIRAVAHAEHKARAEVKALHGVIEREAASGYSADNHERASLIIRLLDFAVARNPELRAITGDIASGILDLLTVDDPVLRITLGFLIQHVIDKLGVDKALGVLIGDLAAPILGRPLPRDLHNVIADISARLDTSEQQWAQFMQDGGSQVEQAGKDWRNITSIAGNLAILAFTVQAVADPAGWAGEIQGTIGVAAADIADRAAALFRG